MAGAPGDLLRLSVDFLRLTKWLVKRAIWRVFDPRHRLPGPCFEHGYAVAEVGGDRARLCGFGRRYANPRLVRLLCPWMREATADSGDAAALCARRSHFRVHRLRYLTVGVALLATWGGLVLAAVRLFVGH